MNVTYLMHSTALLTHNQSLHCEDTTRLRSARTAHNRITTPAKAVPKARAFMVYAQTPVVISQRMVARQSRTLRRCTVGD